MGKLLAAAAKRSILPGEDLMRRISEEDPVLNYFDGAYEDIFTRVMVLSDGEKNIALITADLNRYPAQQILCDRISEKFHIDPIGCIIGSIRNHQAPCGNVPEENPPLCRRIAREALNEYTKLVHDATEAALEEAFAALRPAKIGTITTKSYINSNIEWPTPAGILKGNNYSGFSDKDMLVMRVADMEDKTIGLFVNYAVHSTMFAQNTEQRNLTKIGGDVVGAIARFLEKAGHEEFPVLYMSADGGDQELIVYDEVVYCDVKDDGTIYSVKETLPMDAAWMMLKLLSSQQAVDILNAIDQIEAYTDELDFFGAETHRTVASQMAYDVLEVAPKMGEETEAVEFSRPLDFRLRLAVLNGVGILGYNAEITSRLGAKLRQLVPFENTALVATCYGHEGCVTDTENEKLNGKVKVHSFCRSAQESENAFLGGFGELVAAYENRKNK